MNGDLSASHLIVFELFLLILILKPTRVFQFSGQKTPTPTVTWLSLWVWILRWPSTTTTTKWSTPSPTPWCRSSRVWETSKTKGSTMLRNHKLTENTQQCFTFYGSSRTQQFDIDRSNPKELTPGAFWNSRMCLYCLLVVWRLQNPVKTSRVELIHVESEFWRVFQCHLPGNLLLYVSC